MYELINVPSVVMYQCHNLINLSLPPWLDIASSPHNTSFSISQKSEPTDHLDINNNHNQAKNLTIAVDSLIRNMEISQTIGNRNLTVDSCNTDFSLSVPGNRSSPFGQQSLPL